MKSIDFFDMKRWPLAVLVALAGGVFVAGVLLWLGRIPVFRASAFGQAVNRVARLVQYTVAPGSWRRAIYPRDDRTTPYPGSGEIRVSKPARLLVIEQTEGGVIEEVPFESQEQIDAYLSQGIQVEPLSADGDYLVYTVGRFQRWEELGVEEEDLSEIRDRLLVLSDPFDEAKLFTFRVVGVGVEADESLRIADMPPTQIAVERMGIFGRTNPVAVVKSATELSDEELELLFEVGDTVIVTPAPPYPGLVLEDANEIPYARVVTVRRTRAPRL